MVKKVSGVKNISHVYTSWVKVIFAIVAGLFLGYFVFGSNVGGLSLSTIFNLMILALLTCVLALLLDVRKILLSK